MYKSETISDFHYCYLKYLLLAQKSLKIDPIDETLTDYSKSVIKHTLTEVIDQITIISKGSKNRNYDIMEARLSKLANSETNPINQTLHQLQSVKFEKDINEICNILHETKFEIKQFGKTEHLNEQLKQHIIEATKEYDFICDYIQNIILLKEYCNRSKECYAKYQAKIKDLNDQLQTMETQIDDWKVQNQMKYNLVTKWEKARHQQAEIIFRNEEVKLLSTIQTYEINFTQEEIVIKEIEKFIDFKIKGFEDLIKFWIEKYNTDVADYNAKIQKTKEDIASVQEKIEEVKEKYDVQQVFIDEYREEKRKINEKKKFEQQQYNAATAIQSWWKGTMVRKQIGPYRPKKKPNKKGKKK